MNSDIKAKIGQAVKKMKKQGKIIIFPTETCYGIGCKWKDEKAINKIYKIKKRKKTKKMPVIVTDKKMLEKNFFVSNKEQKIVKKLMPGPISLILKEKKTGKNTCVRITSNKIAANICKKINQPLIATSANISGEKNSYSLKEIPLQIKKQVDFIIDSGKLKKTPPSTIYNAKTKKVLRKGPITIKQIREAIK